MSRKKILNKTITCPICNKKFDVKEYSKQIYCSIECSRISWNGSKKHSILKNCLVCNSEFYTIPSRIKDNRGKYCSKKCWYIVLKETSPFTINNPSKNELFKNKMNDSKRGEKNYNWKGGITPLRTQIYRSDIFKNWRDEIFKRDNYTCKNCGKVGGRIEAHHLKSFSKIILENKILTLEDAINCNELENIDNGVCLCHECHEQTDTYGWKQYHKNTNSIGRFATL